MLSPLPGQPASPAQQASPAQPAIPLKPVIPPKPKQLRETRQPSDTSVSSDLINNNKELNDIIDNIKNKKSRDLIDKKLGDIVNNIGNKKLEDIKDLDKSTFDDLKNTVDKINKSQDEQIDWDGFLSRLIKGMQDPLLPYKPLPDLSRRKPDLSRRKPNMQPNKSKKILDNIINVLDKTLDSPVLSGPGAGEKFKIQVLKYDIKILIIILII